MHLSFYVVVAASSLGVGWGRARIKKENKLKRRFILRKMY